MPRLLRFILLLIFIAALLMFAARLIGSTHSATQLATVMSQPDGTACNHPCLFGVRPGETSFEQAVAILHAHPLTHEAKWLTALTLQLNGPPAYVGFSITPDKVIDSITLSDNMEDTGIPVPGSLADSIPLGELILAFGAPNIALPGSDYFVASFPTVGVIAAVARPDDLRAYVRPDTHMNMVMIYVVRPCQLPVNLYVHPWAGFKTFLRYLNDGKAYRFPHRVSGVSVPPFAQCQA